MPGHLPTLASAYAIDDSDKVVGIEEFPTMETGDSDPIFYKPPFTSYLAYRLAEHKIRQLYADDPRSIYELPETSVLVKFTRVHSVIVGSPNSEALSGHPLYARGLGHYGLYEVQSSSWIRQLERMNSVHSRHNPKIFEACRHFIITFDDVTFEFAAHAVDWTIETGVPLELIRRKINGDSA